MGLSRLIALDNMQHDSAAYRARIADDHKRNMAALDAVTGNTIEPTEPDDAMISVAGDTTNNYTAPANQTGTLAKAAGVAGLAALSGLAGVGAYKMIDDNDNPQPPPAIVAPAEPGRDTSLTYDFGIE